jgi:hypothetical protein
LQQALHTSQVAVTAAPCSVTLWQLVLVLALALVLVLVHHAV